MDPGLPDYLVGGSLIVGLVSPRDYFCFPSLTTCLSCLPQDSASQKACSRGSLLTLDQSCGPLQLAQSVVCAISTRKQAGAQLTPLNLEYCTLVLFRRITNFKDHFKQKARPVSRKQGRRQADLWELETNMVYIAHYRTAIHICEVSQKEKKNHNSWPLQEIQCIISLFSKGSHRSPQGFLQSHRQAVFPFIRFVTESAQDSVWDAVSCSVVPVSRCM